MSQNLQEENPLNDNPLKDEGQEEVTSEQEVQCDEFSQKFTEENEQSRLKSFLQGTSAYVSSPQQQRSPMPNLPASSSQSTSRQPQQQR